MALRHHSVDYDGGSPDLPLRTGDRYYAQDRVRDFWHGIDKAARFAWGSAQPGFDDSSGLLLRQEGEVSKGTGDTLNMPGSEGLCFYQVKVPDSFSSLPPTVKTEDVAVRVKGAAETDMAIASATLDGVSTNYIKLRFKETDGASRARAKKAGSYVYEREFSYEYAVDTTAPTKYDILIGTLVGSSGGPFTVEHVIPVSGKVSGTLLLPSAPGASLEPSISAPSVIKQTDAQHAIAWRSKIFTTKGTAGKVLLQTRDRVRLRSVGTMVYPQDPVYMGDPDVSASGNPRGPSWCPTRRIVSLGNSATPFILFYTMEGGANPIKIADPVSLPGGAIFGTAWSPDGRYCGMVSSATPYVLFYDFASGSPVKIADPATIPTAGGQGCAWSPNGKYFAGVFGAGGPTLILYDWSSGSPVKIADAASLPTTPSWLVWSPDSRFLIVSHGASPYVIVYDLINGAPVTVTTQPTLGTGTGLSACISPDGRLVFVASATFPFLLAFDKHTGLLKTLSQLLGTSVDKRKMAFSPDQRFWVEANSTGNMVLWRVTPQMITAGPAFPGTTPTNCYGAIWTPDGKFLATTDTTNLRVYDFHGSASKGWEIEFGEGEAFGDEPWGRLF